MRVGEASCREIELPNALLHGEEQAVEERGCSSGGAL
jgi:hypothetical protein